MLNWLSIDTWLISFLAISYLLFLFLIAFLGQNPTGLKWSQKPWVYSLCLGVSCTSWAFYGIIGQTSITGQWLSPIYYGTIACFLLGWPILLKMLRVSKQQNLTSIADFIALRYERTPRIALVVTVLALIGTIPYIALQLRAISQSFDLVTGSFQSGFNTTITVALVLTIFCILFGARNVVANKQNQGLMLAIAFSSLVKLLAILAIGLFVCFYVFDDFAQVFEQAESLSQSTNTQTSPTYTLMSQVILGFITIFVTPQLFHMIVIENQNERQLAASRWQYPLYLIAINIFVLPIAMAGNHIFPGGGVNADTYILSIPLFTQQEFLSILVFIGGLAAATSMVIIAAIVLSTMVSTEIITPLLLKLNKAQADDQAAYSHRLLIYRRTAIAVIMLLSLLFERLVNQQSHLSSIGILSLVLLAQFAPAVIGALYWRKANSLGAILGLLSGGLVWCYTLLLPLLAPESSTVTKGLFDLSWLQSQGLFGFTFLDATSHGVLMSLGVNTLVFVIVSLSTSPSLAEKLQAEAFVKKQAKAIDYRLTAHDLTTILKRFVSADAIKQMPTTSKSEQASSEQVEYTRKVLASVIGSASTRLVMSAAEDKSTNVSIEQVVGIVDEANQLFEFNRELLQAGVENIDQGISVVDADMRLVAWNAKYIELLDYPPQLIQAGMPIADLIRFNIEREVIQCDDPKATVDKRLSYMKNGQEHYFQRVMPNNRVLEIRGQPMPGGGFVSTFSDITQHIEAEQKLQKINELLETKVSERTFELSQAKAEAEAANKSKTRFLAAASHDLMQPFNALSLFTDMLKQQARDQDTQKLANHIQDSLTVVEGLLSDLVEISKLEGSGQHVESSDFMIGDVIAPLSNEFEALCLDKGIHFAHRIRNRQVTSDKKLLRRIIQNFLANAAHYSPIGSDNPKILLTARVQQQNLLIEVWDNGPGIPKDKQQQIFREFERLEQNRETPGLGLGLTISERIAKLLNLNIEVESIEGRGSVFRLSMPFCETTVSQPMEVATTQEDKPTNFNGVKVLLIDNDPLLLNALEQQLANWGCQVIAKTGNESVSSFVSADWIPDVIIADYHLDDNKNGVDLSQQLITKFCWRCPCVVCSADPSEALRQHVSEAEFKFIKKPLKALALKRLLKSL